MKNNKPVIGLTSNLEVVHDNVSYTLYYSYTEAVIAAGGIPIVLALGNEEVIDAWLDMIDGILLTGGNDIHPKHYDADPHPELGLTTPKLDESDMMIIRKAYERNIPLLGICRGSHLINVALGGTIIQDIEAEITNPENHLDKGDRSELLSHKVSIKEGSILDKIYKKDEINVNSFHHQAIGKLGEGLHCIAEAPDGVKEAYESENGNVVGTQFHPEELRKFDGHMHEFLKIFMKKAKEHKEKRG